MPYLSSTIFFAVIVVAVLLSLTGYFLLAHALFPAFVERAERAFTRRPVLTFFLGVPVVLVLTLVSVGLINAPWGPVRIVGFLAAGFSLGFTFAGTTGLAARLGRGLASPADEGRPWARVLRAGVVLELSILFPVLGWFLILPIAVIGGAGAATLALFRGRAAVRPAAPVLLQAPYPGQVPSQESLPSNQVPSQAPLPSNQVAR